MAKRAVQTLNETSSDPARAGLGMDSADPDDGGVPGLPPATREESARYVAEMLVGLQQIAEKANLNFLAYLLDMAIEEAEALGRRHS